MYKSYLKVGWRNLQKNKSYSFINIFGFAVGIACCILIAAYVFQETSYDRFHKNADRIVRATMELSNSGNITKVAVTGPRVLPEFKRVFPEVETGVRLFPGGAVVSKGDKLFRETGFVYADSSFFDVFSFRLLQGNPATALKGPNQVILTVSAARKYFGDENALGKTVRVNTEKEYEITGVIEDCPANSQIKFDMLASWSSLTDPVYTEESWFDASHYTYLLLREGATYQSLSEKIPAYFKSQDPENDLAGKNYLTIRVQPLTDIHLNAIVDGGLEPGSDYRYVYMLSIIGLFILVVASANYMNLAIARASERAKEVGLRKVVGALRKQLVVQFISESFIFVLISFIIGLVIAEVLMPIFSTIAGSHLTGAFMMKPVAFLGTAVMLVLVAVVGGFYPSLVLSRYVPVKVLKGNFKTGGSGAGLSKALIILQFVISVGLIISTLVIHHQLEFIQNKKLGYNKDQVVVLRGDVNVLKRMPAIKSTFLANPEILGVTACNQTPVFITGRYNLVKDEEEILITGIRVDKDFIQTMGLNIVEGTDFTELEEQAAFAVTDTIQRPVILNETAVRTFGWTPEEAIGKTFDFQGRKSMVKAVVGDFHFTSMHEAIAPFIIFLSNRNSRILVRVSDRDLSETMSYVEAKWRELVPSLPFEYEFLDDQFNRLYSAEARTGKMFNAFAFLAIGLACLGLFGLITFMTQQRTKEIGIRKVLGASVPVLMILLSKDLLKLVGIAALIAMPLSWWAMEEWLQGFAYRVSVNGWMVLMACVIAILIAALTVSVQAIKAAQANPVKSLKSE